ncbi:hypothetical protein ACSVDM_24950 [Nocardia sp. JW2]|uniref:hypothetical protein n=1 Tax=Nocardia sp. JW2 TaxID=3450738 RepID=UPI003F42DF80
MKEPVPSQNVLLRVWRGPNRSARAAVAFALSAAVSALVMYRLRSPLEFHEFGYALIYFAVPGILACVAFALAIRALGGAEQETRLGLVALAVAIVTIVIAVHHVARVVVLMLIISTMSDFG